MPEDTTPHRVGNAVVTRIPELTLTGFRTADLLPEWRPGAADPVAPWMIPDFLDAAQEHVVMSTHAWLVQVNGRRILVDTGVGNGKRRAMAAFDRLDTPFLDHLAAAGARPDEIDLVLLTHLHSDHVGWNTRLVDGAWRPTFPNARYVMPQVEIDRVQALAAHEGAGSIKAALYVDSVAPVLESGQVDRVGPAGGAVQDGFTFHPTPGHCAGHMSIGLSAAGALGFFAGDVMHHPLQVGHPGWSSVFSEDPDRGRVSRQWALDHMADTGALTFTSHFPQSGVGRVERVGDGFRWVPA